MAIVPIPEQPELFKAKTGMWSILYETVDKRGARSLGSEKLKTTDDRMARKLFKQWKEEGRHAQIMAQDKKQAEAHKAANGNGADHAGLPTLIVPERVKRKAGEPVNLRQARQQLKAIAVQLHAISLTVQLLGEQLNAGDDD